MTDLLGQGQYAQALTKLQQLLKLQQEPLAILGAVGSHFRRLSTARILIDQDSCPENHGRSKKILTCVLQESLPAGVGNGSQNQNLLR